MLNLNVPDNLIIRDYRKGDFTGIESLWKATDLTHPARGDSEKIIEDTIKLGGRMLIMEDKASQKIIGTSWMTFDGRRIHLHHFGILPEYQGRKLSGELLSRSLAHVKEKGYQVKLEVHKDNLKALNLYNKAGFRLLKDYNVYIIRDIHSTDPYQIFR